MARRVHGRWHFTKTIQERFDLALETICPRDLGQLLPQHTGLSQEIPLPAAVTRCYLKIQECARVMAQHLKVLSVRVT